MKKILFIFISIIISLSLVGGGIKIGEWWYEKKEKEPPQEVAQKAIDYINKNFLQKEMKASLKEISEEKEVYKIVLEIGGKEFVSYVTKNGRYLFPEGYDMKKEIEKNDFSESSSQSEIPKKEIPDVKIFVMSYCPFGLQMEKAFLPVYELLKEKAKMGIYFVDYVMHGKKELDENLKQYCIQKEQNDKYFNYLKCFTKKGESDKCLKEAEINQKQLAKCIEKTDKEFKITHYYEDSSTWIGGRFPKFLVHSELNKKYGVRGSPTVVINDKQVMVNKRSPESLKEIICKSFKSQPKECTHTLSDEIPAPGFGEGKGNSSSGGCGG